jgi:two-component system CheB/CheR fusion protein
MPNQADATALVSGKLLDEIEQLRTSLESALEENARLTEDRDRLLRRVTHLSRDLQGLQSSRAMPVPPAPEPIAIEQQNHAEEELRVAFEELQVLTEELEVANTSLHNTNQELDARVEERTRQIREINSALRATEGSLRTIADLVPDLLWRADASGVANWFNQRWFDYTGQAPDEPVGEGWQEALHPVERGSAIADWSRAVSAGAPWEQQLRIRDAAGNYRWFLIRAEPMRDEQDMIHAWFASATDVHEQRSAMDAVRRSELRFRTLVEGMPQLVWRAVDTGQWTWSSPQWTAFTGQAEDASHALGWLEMFHPDDREPAMAAWARAQQTGGLEIEARIFHAGEARYRHFRTRAHAVRGPGGRILE